MPDPEQKPVVCYGTTDEGIHLGGAGGSGRVETEQKPVISDATDLRERVARAIDGPNECWSHELGQTAINMGAEAFFQARERSLERADAAIAVCEPYFREKFAKIAESYEPRCDTCPSGVSNAIRGDKT
jgi:hypothetical protein